MEEKLKELLHEIDEAKKEVKSSIEKEDNQKKREMHLQFLDALERFQENIMHFSILVMLHKLL